MTPSALAALSLAVHFAARPLNPALLHDRAILNALTAIMREALLAAACEGVSTETAEEGW